MILKKLGRNKGWNAVKEKIIKKRERQYKIEAVHSSEINTESCDSFKNILDNSMWKLLFCPQITKSSEEWLNYDHCIMITSMCIFSNTNSMRISKFRSCITIYVFIYLQINSSKVHFHNASKVYYTDDLVLWYSGHWEPVLQFYFCPGSKVFIIVNPAAFIHLSDEFWHDQTNPWALSLFEIFLISKYVSI